MATGNTRLRAFNTLLAAVLLAGVAGTALAVGNKASASASPRTILPTTGTVNSTVTSTGNVSAPQNVAVNFKTGGTVTEIDAGVGQHVTQGQVLAKVDPTTAQQSLAVAQLNLTAAQDKLNQMEQVLTPQQVTQNDAALAQSQQQVNSAQTSLNDAKATIAFDQAQNQAAVTAAQTQLTNDQAHGASPATLANDQSKLAAAQATQTQAGLKDQQTLDQAQNSLTSAQLGLASTQAGNAVKAAPPLPGDLATQQAAVLQAQTAVNQDQLAVDNTTLVAPQDGVVATISGQVGAAVTGTGSAGSSSSGSASSGGGGASSGGSSGGAGGSSAAGGASGGASSAGGSSAGASSSSSSASPSSAGGSTSAFITLTNLQNLSVVAGFTEVDAAKVNTGQPASVTVNALPGQTLTGQVTQIDTLQTVVSNVVTYNATIALNGPLPTGLKPGMTANVSVTVGQKANVLRVPNAAITSRGNASTVRVLTPAGKQQIMSVATGLKGDTFTEIQSGISATDRVIIATTGGAGTAGVTNRPGGGAGGGLGGGGLGGGGIGGGGIGGGGGGAARGGG
jgi:multidrug efflux pump subunit AcrA (membrane-fusion protein)